MVGRMASSWTLVGRGSLVRRRLCAAEAVEVFVIAERSGFGWNFLLKVLSECQEEGHDSGGFLVDTVTYALELPHV